MNQYQTQNVIFSIFILSIVLVNVTDSTKTSQIKLQEEFFQPLRLNTMSSTMDMSLCNSIFKLLRFFYESPRNIIRNVQEMKDDLAPTFKQSSLEDLSLICQGWGHIFTNSKKADTHDMFLTVHRCTDWSDMKKGGEFVDKLSVELDMVGNNAIATFYLNMLDDSDIILDVGKFGVASKITQKNSDLKFVLKEYGKQNQFTFLVI